MAIGQNERIGQVNGVTAVRCQWRQHEDEQGDCFRNFHVEFVTGARDYGRSYFFNSCLIVS